MLILMGLTGGDDFRLQRLAAGLSQRAIAERLAVSVWSVRDWENDRRLPNRRTRLAWLAVCRAGRRQLRRRWARRGDRQGADDRLVSALEATPSPVATAHA
ncbi:unnamed protein product [marine sediment metagenome]|uniref:HTH cro/C1-type domain-containing protein n=1 Tax=marine sediment metagenome TaxID=412755 RepID=X1S3H8_9ZZZZ